MSKIQPSSKHIVCLGGGNAMPRAVLTGLKKYPVSLSVICAMLDTGGSTGRLKHDYKITSPGDIKWALLALSNTSPAIKDLFSFRFENGQFKGHNFANLLIMALELTTNNYSKAIKEMKKLLNVSHQVFPATLDKSNIFAILENGKIISGETNIDRPKHNGRLKIKKVFLRPKAKAYKPALKAIKEADLIVIGPGDLYSSLAQILLVKGMSEAIKKSQAKKVYIANLMTKYGETNNFSVKDFALEVEKYLGSSLDYVIYNNSIPLAKERRIYLKSHPELLTLVRVDKNLPIDKFIGSDLLEKGFIEHDPSKLSKVIIKLLKN
ncbi:YvcK family protein [Candidatus Parcubacteria bacterium]|nr:YvcK family protein [Patescibacteria group bacterium]MBU4466710.1 YvcK family protein [Patescibacteria group bacterium]MCG2688021.1 YvcK family protein [Candidatus Parcubacteria bacterium]